MKKVFYFAAVCAALVGCAKVELKDNYTPKPIVFNSPVVGTSTKAAIADNDYPTTIPFSVWALFSPTMLAGTLPEELLATQVEYLSHVPFSYNDNGTHPAYVNAGAFWPKRDGYLTFKALSPATVYSPYNPTLGWTFSSRGFTIPNYVVNQDDLMYSNYSFDNVADDDIETNKSEESTIHDDYEGYDIAFNHALASIRFAVKLAATDNTNTKYQITSVKLYNHRTQGTFTERNADASKWSGQAAAVVEGSAVTIYDSSVKALTDVPIDGSSLDLFNGAAGQYLVLPQDLNYTDTSPNDTFVMVEIAYTEKIGSLDAVSITPVKIKLHGLLDSGSSAVNTWLPNRRYTYTIVIDRQQIRLDPAVANWTDVAVTGPTI